MNVLVQPVKHPVNAKHDVFLERWVPLAILVYVDIRIADTSVTCQHNKAISLRCDQVGVTTNYSYKSGDAKFSGDNISQCKRATLETSSILYELENSFVLLIRTSIHCMKVNDIKWPLEGCASITILWRTSITGCLLFFFPCFASLVITAVRLGYNSIFIMILVFFACLKIIPDLSSFDVIHKACDF